MLKCLDGANVLHVPCLCGWLGDGDGDDIRWLDMDVGDCICDSCISCPHIYIQLRYNNVYDRLSSGSLMEPPVYDYNHTYIYIYIKRTTATTHIRRVDQLCRRRWTVQPQLLVYTYTHAATGDVNGSVSGTDEYDEWG